MGQKPPQWDGKIYRAAKPGEGFRWDTADGAQRRAQIARQRGRYAQKDNPKDFLKTLSPMGTISTSEDIANAVVYLTESRQITGEVLHVDGGAHNGKW